MGLTGHVAFLQMTGRDSLLCSKSPSEVNVHDSCMKQPPSFLFYR